MFSGLIDVALVSKYILYRKLDNDISLPNFKIVVAKASISRQSNRKRSFPTSRPSKEKCHEPFMHREVPNHMSEFQEKQIRCHYWKNEGLDNKYVVSCQTCAQYLCLNKDRNCVVFHHDCIAYYICF